MLKTCAEFAVKNELQKIKKLLIFLELLLIVKMGKVCYFLHIFL